RIIVGMDDCGIAAGADKVFDALIEDVASRGIKNTRVYRSGCMGRCDLEPTVEVLVPGQPKVTYVKVDAAKAAEIVEKHLVGGTPVAAYTAENA
ncbi:MAG: (2Fe-2S) ferredoxin domain-containing protein, partial [Clostridia bacterium]|nr:(2Fe-2S) ferredoxin domain-containing protein [Clostridia bacterium]